jgi:hypothetical protein
VIVIWAMTEGITSVAREIALSPAKVARPIVVSP